MYAMVSFVQKNKMLRENLSVILSNFVTPTSSFKNAGSKAVYRCCRYYSLLQKAISDKITS
jgi:hypothetical protein